MSHPGYAYYYTPFCSVACAVGCDNQWPVWLGDDAPGYINTNGDDYTRSATCELLCNIPTSTPTPPASLGNIQVRAVQVDPTDTSCAAIAAVPTSAGEINGTVLSFSANSVRTPTPQTQSGANYVTFPNTLTGTYYVVATPPTANWSFAQGCWHISGSSTYTSGMAATLGNNETLIWDIGYTLGTAWAQTGGGDVYAAARVGSYIPAVTPRVFNTDGAGGSPGVVTYGATHDFDSDPVSSGDSLVSSKNWLVNATRTTVDYYDLFYHRFGAPTTTDNASFADLTAVSKPASRLTPYYISGDMTTTGDWTVNNGETITFLVDGNVTIGGRMNITANSTGSIIFIAHGDITVDPSVGTTALSTTPVIEGIYIATKADHTGTFRTGTSQAVGTARLVGKGMFIADTFDLKRDLDAYGGNTASAAELFTYNPQLLLTMPEPMKELSVTWQEVAP